MTALLALTLAACGESVRRLPAGANDGDGAGGEGPTSSAGQLLLLDSYGLPFPELPVLVDDTVVTTDEQGLAALPAVGDRYDLSVVVGIRSYVFVGMKTRTPVVRLFGAASGKNISAMTLSLALPNLRSDQNFVYSAGFDGVAPDQQFFGTSTEDSTLTLYGYWVGASNVTFSAEAFVVDVDPNTRAPVAFSGYAAQAWKIEPDTDLSWTPTLAAPPFANDTIHIDMNLPDGASVYSYTIASFEPSGRESSVGPVFDPASLDLLVPGVPDTAYTIDVASSVDGRNGFSARVKNAHAGDRLTLDAHAAPQQLAPDDGAVVTRDTEFTWTADEAAVYQLDVSTPNGDGTDGLVTITTAEPSARLPDLSALGSPFPIGRTLRWQIFAREGTSLEKFAADGRYGSSGITSVRQASAAP